MKAILVDLGNTILQEEEYDLRRGLRSAIGRHPELWTMDCEAAIVDVESRIRDCYLAGEKEFTLRDWIASHHTVAGHDARIALEIELEVWESTVVLTPMPGVREALTEFRMRGIPVAFITNTIFSADVVAWELERWELLTLCRFVLSSATSVYRKPNPTMFLDAAKQLGADPAMIAVIGDRYDADVVGAFRAGMTPLHFGVEESGSGVRHASSWSAVLDLLRGDQTAPTSY